MAVTRLERKLKRDRAKSRRRKDAMKRLNAQPPVVNIDIEAIKAEFEKKGSATSTKKETKKEEPKATTTPSETNTVEVKVEEKPAKVKEEKTEAKAKPEAKAKKETKPKAKKEDKK